MWEKFKARFKFDKDSGLKWLCLGAAGLIGLLADVFDRRRKDRLYKETIEREVSERVTQLLESKTEE